MIKFILLFERTGAPTGAEPLHLLWCITGRSWTESGKEVPEICFEREAAAAGAVKYTYSDMSSSHSDSILAVLYPIVFEVTGH